LPEGWEQIPGARGCTPQACAFRDHYRELATFEAELFGLSTQPTDDQREMAERLRLPLEILSDAALTFANALKLRLSIIRERRASHRVASTAPP
jgi:peroxiredoxin